MSSYSWDDNWEQGFNQFVDDLHEGIFRILQVMAIQLEADMKRNAPWMDRTANARQSLWAEASKTQDGAELNFGHGMEYGIFLELKNNGKYAIVLPTLDIYALRVMQVLLRIFNQQ